MKYQAVQSLHYHLQFLVSESVFLSSLQTKKIGILATNRWGNDSPKFNTPETKVDLIKFCAEIAPECAIPEIDFNEEGIASCIKTFFIEQWRYKKKQKPPWYYQGW